MNLCTKQKQTHRHSEQVCGGQEKWAGGRMDGESLGLADANHYI